MQWVKTTISLFLIFCYSLGFAHNLVPHSHQGHGEDLAHQHDHTSDHSGHDHKHITHNDHEDEGFLDFVRCLFVDLEHNDANLEFYQPANSIDSPSAPIILYQVLLIVTTPALAECNICLEADSSFEEPGIYQAPLLPSFSLRGPPSNS